MTDIVEFIEAQLAIDEQLARDAGATRSGTIASWHVDCRCPEKDAGIHADSCYECRVEGDNIVIYDEGGHDEDQARHIARHDPVRVLRDVEAKRAILAEHEHVPAVQQSDAHRYGFGCRTCHNDPDCGETLGLGWCETVRHMAAPFSDSPGYNPAWGMP